MAVPLGAFPDTAGFKTVPLGVPGAAGFMAVPLGAFPDTAGFKTVPLGVPGAAGFTAGSLGAFPVTAGFKTVPLRLLPLRFSSLRASVCTFCFVGSVFSFAAAAL